MGDVRTRTWRFGDAVVGIVFLWSSCRYREHGASLSLWVAVVSGEHVLHVLIVVRVCSGWFLWLGAGVHGGARMMYNRFTQQKSSPRGRFATERNAIYVPQSLVGLLI